MEYAYNALDERIFKLVDPDGDGAQAATFTYFLYANQQLTTEFVNTGSVYVATHRYLYAPGTDQVLADLAVGSAAAVHWTLGDQEGSIRDVVAVTGLNQYADVAIEYDSFGNVTNGQQAASHLLYAGRELDVETGYDYNRARYYDPQTGRFLSQDPAGFAAGQDPYLYVLNNPMTFTDPSGLEARGIYSNPVSYGGAPAGNITTYQTQNPVSAGAYDGFVFGGHIDGPPDMSPNYSNPSSLMSSSGGSPYLYDFSAPPSAVAVPASSSWFGSTLAGISSAYNWATDTVGAGMYNTAVGVGNAYDWTASTVAAGYQGITNGSSGGGESVNAQLAKSQMFQYEIQAETNRQMGQMALGAARTAVEPVTFVTDSSTTVLSALTGFNMATSLSYSYSSGGLLDRTMAVQNAEKALGGGGSGYFTSGFYGAASVLGGDRFYNAATGQANTFAGQTLTGTTDISAGGRLLEFGQGALQFGNVLGTTALAGSLLKTGGSALLNTINSMRLSPAELTSLSSGSVRPTTGALFPEGTVFTPVENGFARAPFSRSFSEAGSVNYSALDSLGRPAGAYATITQDMLGAGTPANSRILPPGWRGGAFGEARGHLLADMLGGSGDVAENLVTMQQLPANSPVMRGFEYQVRAAVQSGQVVRYSSVPIYNSTNLVPQGITLTAEGSNGFTLNVTILNPIGR